MKKFLYCLIFLIAFSGVSSAVLANSGYDGANRQIKDCEVIESTLEQNNNETSITKNDSITNKGKSKVVFDVVLIEFKGCHGYYSKPEIDLLDIEFNDNDRTNNIYSVYEQFQDLSYNQVEVNANFSVYRSDKYQSYYDKQTTSFELEIKDYNEARAGSTPVKTAYGEANSYMAVFSVNNVDTFACRLWPHAHLGYPFVSIPYCNSTPGTITHEILHTFSINDYYNPNETTLAPVGVWDTSAEGTNWTANNLMYNKLKLGWVEESAYNDDKETGVELIAASGTYTLSPTISTTGTRAYKFGFKQDEKRYYFMAEYRKGDPKGLDPRITDGLIIYAIDEFGFGNFCCDSKTYEINVLGGYSSDYERHSASLNSKYDYFGGSKNSSKQFRYIDGTIANYRISNIVIDKEANTLSFDFSNDEYKDFVEGSVYHYKDYGLRDASIYVNGKFACKTNWFGDFIIENIEPNSILTIETYDKKNIFEPITINPNTFNLKIYGKESQVIGTVIASNGRLDSGAKVYINGKEVAKTDIHGIFNIETVEPNSLLEVVSRYDDTIYEPIIVNPYDKDLKIRGKEVVGVTILIQNGTAENTYSVNKIVQGKRVDIGTFKGNETFAIKDAEKGEIYYVSGYLVVTTIKVTTTPYIYRITMADPPPIDQTQNKEDEEEEKSTLGKVADAITSVPGKVKNTLENAYDTLTETAGNIADKAGNWYDRAKAKVRNFFHF